MLPPTWASPQSRTPTVSQVNTQMNRLRTDNHVRKELDVLRGVLREYPAGVDDTPEGKEVQETITEFLAAYGKHPYMKEVLYGEAVAGRCDNVRFMLDQGTPIPSDLLHMILSSDEHGITPEITKCVRLLIDKGADVNKVRLYSQRTSTPLSLIASQHAFIPETEDTLRNRLDIAKSLVARGADVNFHESRTGLTLLMLAAKQGADANMFTFLIQSGADVLAKNDEGKTIYDMLSDKNSKLDSSYYMPLLPPRPSMASKVMSLFSRKSGGRRQTSHSKRRRLRRKTRRSTR